MQVPPRYIDKHRGVAQSPMPPSPGHSPFTRVEQNTAAAAASVPAEQTGTSVTPAATEADCGAPLSQGPAATEADRAASGRVSDEGPLQSGEASGSVEEPWGYDLAGRTYGASEAETHTGVDGVRDSSKPSTPAAIRRSASLSKAAVEPDAPTPTKMVDGAVAKAPHLSPSPDSSTAAGSSAPDAPTTPEQQIEDPVQTTPDRSTPADAADPGNDKAGTEDDASSRARTSGTVVGRQAIAHFVHLGPSSCLRRCS